MILEMTDKLEDQIKAAYLLIKTNSTLPIQNKEEFERIVQAAGFNPTSKFLKKYWKDDKGMTFDEFSEIIQSHTEEIDDNTSLLKAFRSIDTNGDNYISLRELEIIMNKHGEGVSREEINAMFSVFDKDKNGLIDYNEFLNMVGKTKHDMDAFACRKLKKNLRTEKSKSKSERRNSHKDKAHLMVNGASSSKHEDNGSPAGSITEYTTSSKQTTFPIQFRTDGQTQINKDKLIEKVKKISRKGCLYIDEESGKSKFISHYYQLKLTENTQVLIKIQPITNNDFPSTSEAADFFVFVLESSTNKCINVTKTSQIESGCYFSTLDLKRGSYDLIPFTTGCKIVIPSRTKQRSRVNLVEEGVLTKQFRMVLMNIFDMIDLDDNGGLSRREFDLFNVRTGDEHVQDDDWTTVIADFASRDGELSLRGFIDMHKLEAEQCEGDEDDMWISLEALGYNAQLQMDRAYPFKIEVQHDAVKHHDVTLDVINFLNPYEGSHFDAIVQYLLENSNCSAQLDDSLNVHAFVTDHWAALIANNNGSRDYRLDPASIFQIDNCLWHSSNNVHGRTTWTRHPEVCTIGAGKVQDQLIAFVHMKSLDENASINLS